MLIQALINRGMCNRIQMGAPVFMLTKRDGLSRNDRWKCFAWKGAHTQKRKKKSFYRCSFCGEMSNYWNGLLKKSLSPNLSKTLQVLGTVAIVSRMNVIQLILAAHFIPLVHLLISKYIIHTLSPERDLCSPDPCTLEHTASERTSRIHEYRRSVIKFLFWRWLFRRITSCVIKLKLRQPQRCSEGPFALLSIQISNKGADIDLPNSRPSLRFTRGKEQRH